MQSFGLQRKLFRGKEVCNVIAQFYRAKAGNSVIAEFVAKEVGQGDRSNEGFPGRRNHVDQAVRI